MFRNILAKNKAFVIAEVGQNHNGDFETAKQYIRIFNAAGADAIKFQMRDNKYLFSKTAYNKPYNSENAFGKTYGQHREALELSFEEISKLKIECHDVGVKFIVTPFDEPSLEKLVNIGVDALKVASFDSGNLPFLNLIAKTNIPVIMSVGGSREDQIKSSIKTLRKWDSEVVVLHCVSEYPCPFDKLGLSNIETLAKNFPDLIIGSSDHFNGILSGPVAYLKGARVFEKHVTLNRSFKGTDHNFALEQEGFRKFVRDINRVPDMLSMKPESELGKEKVFAKLGKSIVSKKTIIAGEVLNLDNLSGKIFDKVYIPVRETANVIGCKAKIDITEGAPITYESIIS